MKSIVQFHIFEEGEYYTAEGINVSIVTQGKTLDELAANIKEAVELHFEGEDIEDLGFSREPSVLLNFELPRIAYA